MRRRAERSKILAERLKEVRTTRAKMTQRQFGEKYGVDDSTVSRWEKARIAPEQQTIKAIASDWDVSIDWLMGKEENNQLDLQEIKKALLTKELTYGGHELTKDEQDSIRNILLAVIEREEKRTKN
jgi:transcriptional regulator with XRE-family HTH domain